VFADPGDGLPEDLHLTGTLAGIFLPRHQGQVRFIPLPLFAAVTAASPLSTMSCSRPAACLSCNNHVTHHRAETVQTSAVLHVTTCCRDKLIETS
jgi:hypothetical protein